MKRALINKVFLAMSAIFIFTAASIGINAKETLIDMSDANVGGFGGPVFKVSAIKGEQTIEMGGMGGATFTGNNRSLILGGGGYGLVNEIDWGASNILEMGYGGFIIGYTFNPEALVHFESHLLLGGGGVVIRDPLIPGSNIDTGTFLVSELTVQVDINLTEFMELGIGASYRLTSKPGITGLDAADLSKPGLVISFQFGNL